MRYQKKKIIQTIVHLKNYKAAELDKVTLEILKHGVGTPIEEMTYLFNLI